MKTLYCAMDGLPDYAHEDPCDGDDHGPWRPRKSVDIQTVVKYKKVQPVAPEEHMAARSKKPSIARRSRKPAEEPAAQEAGDLSAIDLIAEHLRVISNAHLTNLVTIFNTRMEEIVNLLTERNELAKKLDTPAEPSDTQAVKTEVLERLSKLEEDSVATNNGILNPILERLDRLETAAKSVALPEHAPAKRGRPPKAPEASAPAPVAEQKPAPKSEVIICKHLRMETLRPGLERCLDCGAVIDVPVKEAAPSPAPAAQAVVETKPAPAPAPAAPAVPATNGTKPPSVDDVRAVAITYAGKHGKPKLSELLKEFGASNLSTVPEESRAALMAKLQAGI